MESEKFSGFAMKPDPTEQLMRILSGASQNAPPQVAAELLPILYDELRRLAQARVAQEASGQTLDATALVHEAYLRLTDGTEVQWDGRAHFFGAAAEAMRRILVEHARARGAKKRGGGRRRVEAPDLAAVCADDAALLALDEALTELEALDSRMARIVKLRYFAGLSVQQTAEQVGVTTRTVERDWVAARAWLRSRVEGGDHG
jgi:RNA polymerase sigma factor (TIGR02999 family)